MILREWKIWYFAIGLDYGILTFFFTLCSFIVSEDGDKTKKQISVFVILSNFKKEKKKEQLPNCFFLDDLKKQNNKVFSVLEDIFRNILVENRNFQIFTYSSKAAGLLLKSVVELMFPSL